MVGGEPFVCPLLITANMLVDTVNLQPCCVCMTPTQPHPLQVHALRSELAGGELLARVQLDTELPDGRQVGQH